MKLSRLLLLAALTLAIRPTPSSAATPTISAAQYRARLQGARDSIDRLQRRPPVDAKKILSGLSNDVIVQRSDGTTQLVHGDTWAARLKTPRDGSNPAKLTGHQARELRRAFEDQLKVFDAWNLRKSGTFYQSADAQTIVAQLEATGQIRTQPLWWQSSIARVKHSIGEAFTNALKWLQGLFPTSAPSANVPDAKWLLWVFWGFVIAILGVIFYFIFRAFDGRWGRFGWGRRKKAINAGFEGEDAELLLLPPDELRQRAQRFATEGNFREALRHRFIALLLHLDQYGVWRYDIRRTNWEHIGILQREVTRTSLVAPLSDLTQRFDRVRYGGADCTASEWSQFDQNARSLESQVGASHTAPDRQVAEVTR